MSENSIKFPFHKVAKQFYKSVGYGWNQAETKLVQRVFYFGNEIMAAVHAAAKKQDEWKALKANWPAIAATLKPLYPGKDLRKPFWPEKMLAPVAKKTEEVRAKVPARPHDMTVKAAKELYIEAQKARRGLMGKKGLKQSTLNTILATLEVALKPLALDTPISGLDYNVIESVVHHHYRHCAKERTALNYCRAFKSWLDWLEDRPDLNFTRCKGMDRLFRLGTPEAEPFIPTLAQVKKIIASAHSDQSKLYMLLALNCGFTAVDISDLRLTELEQRGDDLFVWRKRSKTSHQNQFSTFHLLFPETAAMVEQFKAPGNNPHGRAFLTKDGMPLMQIGDGYRTRNVADTFGKTLKAAGLEGSGFTFKSFRKFSSTQLLAMTKQDNMTRMFLAQKVPGVLRNYVKDDFTQLTAALRQYHAWLKEQKVI